MIHSISALSTGYHEASWTDNKRFYQGAKTFVLHDWLTIRYEAGEQKWWVSRMACSSPLDTLPCDIVKLKLETAPKPWHFPYHTKYHSQKLGPRQNVQYCMIPTIALSTIPQPIQIQSFFFPKALGKVKIEGNYHCTTCEPKSLHQNQLIRKKVCEYCYSVWVGKKKKPLLWYTAHHFCRQPCSLFHQGLINTCQDRGFCVSTSMGKIYALQHASSSADKRPTALHNKLRWNKYYIHIML